MQCQRFHEPATRVPAKGRPLHGQAAPSKDLDDVYTVGRMWTRPPATAEDVADGLMIRYELSVVRAEAALPQHEVCRAGAER
jgi:hypothetical protein